MGLFGGDSKSSTESYDQRTQVSSGIDSGGGDVNNITAGGNVTTSDQGAIRAAFDFGGRAFDFGDTAIGTVETISGQAIDTLARSTKELSDKTVNAISQASNSETMQILKQVGLLAMGGALLWIVASKIK